MAVYGKIAETGGSFVMTYRLFVRCLVGTSIAALILTASVVATMAQERNSRQSR